MEWPCEWHVPQGAPRVYRVRLANAVQQPREGELGTRRGSVFVPPTVQEPTLFLIPPRRFLGMCETRSHRCHYLQSRGEVRQLPVRGITTVSKGRSTPNFARTLKYNDASEDIFADRQSITLYWRDRNITPGTAAAADRIEEVDLRFSTHEDREAFLSALGRYHGALEVTEKALRTDDSEFLEGGGGASGLCYRIVSHAAAKNFILATIALSVAVIMAARPSHDSPGRESVLQALERFSSAVFTLELLLKLVALEGVAGYTRDPWNCLDGFVVFASWITLLPTGDSVQFSALRAFRAVRVLRSIRWLNPLREVLDTFLTTLPMVLIAFSVLLYGLLVASVGGMDLFGDALSHRCVVPRADPPVVGTYGTAVGPSINETTEALSEPPRFCSSPDVRYNLNGTAMMESVQGSMIDPVDPTAPLSDGGCPLGTRCAKVAPPLGGFVGFHSFPVAFVTTFRLSTRAPGIQTVARGVMEATHPVAILFFLGMVVLMSFLVLSLFIAIVRTSFKQVRTRQQKEAKLKKLQMSKDQAQQEAERMETRDAEGENGDDASVAHQPLHTERHREEGGFNVTVKSFVQACVERWDESCGEYAEQHVCFCIPRRSRAIQGIRWLVTRPRFEYGVIVLILINTITLGIVHEGMSVRLRAELTIIEAVLTFLFLMELVLKYIGLGGFRQFCFGPGWQWNMFDAVVVGVTTVELCLELSVGTLTDLVQGKNPDRDGAVNLSALRAPPRVFRALRLTKALRKNEQVYSLIRSVVASVKDLAGLVAFLILLIIVYGAMSVQFFAGKMGDPPPRGHFDDFGAAALSYFRILTGGGGWGIFSDMVESDTENWVKFGVAPFVFFSFLVLGNITLINFIIVTIIMHLGLTPEQKQARQRARGIMRLREVVKQLQTVHPSLPDQLRRVGSQYFASDIDRVLSSSSPRRSPSANGAPTPTSVPSPSSAASGSDADFSEWGDDEGGAEDAWYYRLYTTVCRWPFPERNRSLGCFGPTSRIRQGCSWLVERPEFDNFIMVCIVVGSALLAFETPDSPTGTTRLVFDILEWGSFVVFTVEALAKIIAYGFFRGEGAYLKDGWNVLDFLVVVFVWAGITGGSAVATVSRIVRLARLFRPLRFVRRLPGLRVVISSLLSALPSVFYAIVLTTFLLFVFAVLGISLFGGRFVRCNDNRVTVEAECQGLFIDPSSGALVARVWSRPWSSFNHLGEATQALFEVFTLRDWVPILHASMDVNGRDEQPERGASPANALYWVFFIFVVAFYMHRIFVGVIIGRFQQLSGSALLTETQREFRVVQQLVAGAKPVHRRPQHWLRRAFRQWYVRYSYHWKSTVTLVTLAYGIGIGIMASREMNGHDVSSERWTFYWILFVVHGIDLIGRNVALGWRDLWNKDGLWIVWETAAWLAMLVLGVVWSTPPRGIGLARLLRFSRLTDMTGMPDGLRLLQQVIGAAIPAIINVTGVVLLFAYIFAVAGVSFFGSTRFGTALSPHANFRNFSEAFMTVLQTLLGENWIPLLRDTSVEAPHCTPGEDCGSGSLAAFYFYTLYVTFFTTLLNLYVAGVLDAYIESRAGSRVLGLTTTSKTKRRLRSDRTRTKQEIEMGAVRRALPAAAGSETDSESETDDDSEDEEKTADELVRQSPSVDRVSAASDGSSFTGSNPMHSSSAGGAKSSEFAPQRPAKQGDEESAAPLTMREIRQFQRVWSIVQDDASRSIAWWKLPLMFRMLGVQGHPFMEGVYPSSFKVRFLVALMVVEEGESLNNSRAKPVLDWLAGYGRPTSSRSLPTLPSSRRLSEQESGEEAPGWEDEESGSSTRVARTSTEGTGKVAPEEASPEESSWWSAASNAIRGFCSLIPTTKNGRDRLSRGVRIRFVTVLRVLGSMRVPKEAMEPHELILRDAIHQLCTEITATSLLQSYARAWLDRHRSLHGVRPSPLPAEGVSERDRLLRSPSALSEEPRHPASGRPSPSPVAASSVARSHGSPASSASGPRRSSAAAPAGIRVQIPHEPNE